MLLQDAVDTYQTISDTKSKHIFARQVSEKYRSMANTCEQALIANEDVDFQEVYSQVVFLREQACHFDNVRAQHKQPSDQITLEHRLDRMYSLAKWFEDKAIKKDSKAAKYAAAAGDIFEEHFNALSPQQKKELDNYSIQPSREYWNDLEKVIVDGRNKHLAGIVDSFRHERMWDREDRPNEYTFSHKFSGAFITVGNDKAKYTFDGQFSGLCGHFSDWAAQGAVISGHNALNFAVLSGKQALASAQVSGDNALNFAAVSGEQALASAQVSGDNALIFADVSGASTFQGAKLTGHWSLIHAVLSGRDAMIHATISGDQSLLRAEVSGYRALFHATIGDSVLQNATISGQQTLQEASIIGKNALTSAIIEGEDALCLAQLSGEYAGQGALITGKGAMKNCVASGVNTLTNATFENDAGTGMIFSGTRAGDGIVVRDNALSNARFTGHYSGAESTWATFAGVNAKFIGKKAGIMASRSEHRFPLRTIKNFFTL